MEINEKSVKLIKLFPAGEEDLAAPEVGQSAAAENSEASEVGLEPAAEALGGPEEGFLPDEPPPALLNSSFETAR